MSRECWWFVEGSGDQRDLHVLTHSFPTRRSAERPRLGGADRAAREGQDRGAALRTRAPRLHARGLAALQRQLLGSRDRLITRLISSSSCSSRIPSSACKKTFTPPSSPFHSSRRLLLFPLYTLPLSTYYLPH